MVKQYVPKKVTLPNGRRFLVRYKRTTTAYLLAITHLASPYKQRAAPKRKRKRWRAAAAPAARQGQGITDIFCFPKKIAKSKVERNIGKLAFEKLNKK